MKTMKFGIAVFPGTNCDRDCYHVLDRVLGVEVEYIFFRESQLETFDCIILPGGFSYGDYLRPGAIARFTPAMRAIEAFARTGGLVLGICNGFQILLEAGLLPGSMTSNSALCFVCRDITLKVERTDSPFTSRYSAADSIQMPIAHADGNYYLDQDSLTKLEDEGRVLLRYADADGTVDESSNPNGSANNIAGIINEQGNIFGLMPHPERASESLLGSGSEDGKKVFLSMIDHLRGEKGGHESLC